MQAENQTNIPSARIPRFAQGADPSRLSLSPEEAYLLSRVDGKTPWSVLRQIGGLPPHEVDRRLRRWLEQGVLMLADEGTSLSQPTLEDAPSQAPEALPEAQIDPSLEIPAQTQQRVLEFQARLGCPYHEILGVTADADVKALKRAYFALSKEFHPDRYFRRSIGPFAELLERIFKKIVEAYELLSDPTARVEIARSLTQGPSNGNVPEASDAAAPSSRFHPARHVFSMHARARRERRRKAKALFESGMAAFAQERWLEASAGVRLAIAFDPWNEAYKDRFASVQRKANDERAAQLVREGEAALELRDLKTAFHHFEEALHHRPHDAALNHRTAKLVWAGESDLRRAKEFATQACELSPDNAEYHRTLGQIYKEAGLEANARRELELALSIDPNDAEAKVELRSLGRRLKFPISLGGRR
jgi:curved DNA-binding protein CbpA